MQQYTPFTWLWEKRRRVYKFDMVWLPHIWFLTYVPHICDIFPPQGLRGNVKDCEHDFHITDTCTTWILHTNGKAIQTLMFEGWNHFFLKGGCIYNLNFFSKTKEAYLAGNRYKFTSKNHGLLFIFFYFFWKVNSVCLEMTKTNLSSGTGPCIYQNIGGEGVL